MGTGGERQPVKMSIEEARDAMNQWSDGGFFRFKRLGDRVAIDEIRAHESFTLRLQTQYEDRTVAQASLPYSGERLDDSGVPPGPWELPVTAPQDFEARTVTVPVPHTDRVQVCRPCNGSGQVACPHCLGAGRTSCTWCMGMGTKTVTQHITHINPDGTQSLRPETRTEVCSSCGGAGRIFCSPCGGSGRQVCSSCRGHGRLKTFDQLTVHFRTATLTAVVDETELRDDQLKGVTGDVLVDKRSPRIESTSGVNPAVDHQFAQLLAKSQAVTENATRVLFEHIHIERILIREVVYRYADSPARRFWIFGSEKRMSAPGAPIAWWRWAALTGVILTTLALVLLALTHHS
jgi:hypothetical protein